MCKGFVKIPRRLFETRWWHQKRIFSESDAIIDLYQSADRKNMVSMSIRSLADKWLWEQTKVFRFIQKLTKDGYIETSKTISGTTIKIIDFGVSATPSATQPATPSATHESPSTKGLSDIDATLSATPSATQPATLSRAYKNDNNISCLNGEDKNIRTPYNPPRGYEKIDFSFVDKSFSDIFFDFLQYKIDRKDKKYTIKGLNALYKKMVELSGNDADVARKIVEQSYANNWSGIFELKDNINATGHYNSSTGYQQRPTHTDYAEAAMRRQILSIPVPDVAEDAERG